MPPRPGEETVYACELRVAGDCDGTFVAVLSKALRLTLARNMFLDDARCTEDGHSAVADCRVRATDLQVAKAALLNAGARALRAVGGVAGDRAITVRAIGVALGRSDDHASLSDEERLGWYNVRVRLTAAVLRADPSVGPYIRSELPQWQRFRRASVGWESGSEVAEITLAVYARSPRAAFLGTRDGVEGVMTAATHSTDYSIEPLGVTWLGSDATASSATKTTSR
jgi:hypothetical protein